MKQEIYCLINPHYEECETVYCYLSIPKNLECDGNFILVEITDNELKKFLIRKKATQIKHLGAAFHKKIINNSIKVY